MKLQLSVHVDSHGGRNPRKRKPGKEREQPVIEGRSKPDATELTNT